MRGLVIRVARRPDPLGIAIELPLARSYYPLGFRLDLETNSWDVIDAAGEAWTGERPEFDGNPLVMRVRVTPEGPLSGPATHAKHGYLYSVVSDAHNFAAIDLDAQIALVQVSQATASDHSWLRWFFVESLAYVMLDQRRVVMVHAACVARNGAGVLLCGPSGAGKSTLSYAAARAGWTWLSDDCSCLLPDSPGRIALARSRQARFRLDARELFPELDGYVARARPTGKIGIEVTMGDVPGVRTARRAPVGGIAFLERGPGRPHVEPVARDEAAERMLADMPVYGGETDAIHERAVRAVAEATAFRLHYDSIQDGVKLLSDL